MYVWIRKLPSGKRVSVVVLGDIGRSPRMQYHAMSFAEEGYVPRQTMRVSGRGEMEPLADNSTDAGRSQNRRVVIEVITH